MEWQNADEYYYKQYHYRYRKVPRVAVITDSILKYCVLENFAVLLPFRGADISDIIYYQERGILEDWIDYDLVIVHVGTNDIANFQAKLVLTRLKKLVKLLKNSNPWLDVIISSILPRPVDIDNRY